MTTNSGTPMIGGAPRLPQDLATNQGFGLNVSMGMYPSYSTLHKFGENSAIDTTTDPEEIWEAGGVYVYDADGTAPIVSLISDDGGDTEPILVTGLDINGHEVEQTITLTGGTRVALTTPLWRVYRMANLGTTDLAGTVYCYTGTGGVPAANAIRAIISDTNNQTLMALYTIPAHKVGFMFRKEFGVSRGVAAAEVLCNYCTREFGKVFRIQERINLSNSGTSTYEDEHAFPDPLTARMDIRMRVEETSANAVGVFATFDILLVDEELFPSWFLTSIGQPE